MKIHIFDIELKQILVDWTESNHKQFFYTKSFDQSDFIVNFFQKIFFFFFVSEYESFFKLVKQLRNSFIF